MGMTPEVVDEICRRLSDGEPLRAICRTEGLPKKSAIYALMEADKEFAGRIARARKEGFDALAEQCLDIADDERADWVMTQKGEVTDETAIGRAKLRIWTRLQLLSKWDPRRYGDKLELAGDPERPLVHAVERRLVKPRANPSD